MASLAHTNISLFFFSLSLTTCDCDSRSFAFTTCLTNGYVHIRIRDDGCLVIPGFRLISATTWTLCNTPISHQKNVTRTPCATAVSKAKCTHVTVCGSAHRPRKSNKHNPFQVVYLDLPEGYHYLNQAEVALPCR